MADTNVRIKLSADGSEVRSELRRIDAELSQLGNDTTIPRDNNNPSGTPHQQGSSSQDQSRQAQRDRNMTLLVRELILLRREITQLNRNNAQSTISGHNQPTGIPPTPPSGGGTPPTPPGGGPPPPTPPTGGGGGAAGLMAAIGKLTAVMSTVSSLNNLGNLSQSGEAQAYRTYGTTLAFKDYNTARQNAGNLGTDFGYNASESMGVVSTQMHAGGGWAGIEASNTDARALMGTSKAWNLDTQQMARLSGTLMGQGTIKAGEAQKFASMLAQSIVDNGMEHRAQEQLDVLQSINENLSQSNVKVTETELQKQLGAYTALVNKTPELAGQRGANLVNKLSNTAMSDNQMLDIWAGAGTKFIGAEGVSELNRIKETDPSRYLNMVYEGALEGSGGDKELAMKRMRSVLQQGHMYSQEELDTILPALAEGSFTDEKLKSIQAKRGNGDNATAERLKNYQDSNLSKLEKADAEIENAKMDAGGWVNQVRAPLLNLYNELPDGLQAAGAVAGAIGPGMLLYKGGSMLANALGGSSAGGAGGAAGSGIFQSARSWLGNTANQGTTMSTLSKVGKVAKPVAALIGAYETGDKLIEGDYKGAAETAGSAAGGIGGAMGGAAAGAAIGAAFGGVGAIPGAAIGGLIGTLGGGWLGSEAGEAVGGGIYDLFSGDDETPKDTVTAQPQQTQSADAKKSTQDLIDALNANTDATNNSTLVGDTSSKTTTGATQQDLDKLIKTLQEKEKKDEQKGLFSSLFGTDKAKQHAVGKDRVPYNNYPALLHKDEMVLTKAEADEYAKKSAEQEADHITPLLPNVPKDVPDSWNGITPLQQKLIMSVLSPMIENDKVASTIGSIFTNDTNTKSKATTKHGNADTLLTIATTLGSILSQSKDGGFTGWGIFDEQKGTGASNPFGMFDPISTVGGGIFGGLNSDPLGGLLGGDNKNSPFSIFSTNMGGGCFGTGKMTDTLGGIFGIGNQDPLGGLFGTGNQDPLTVGGGIFGGLNTDGTTKTNGKAGATPDTQKGIEETVTQQPVAGKDTQGISKLPKKNDGELNTIPDSQKVTPESVNKTTLPPEVQAIKDALPNSPQGAGTDPSYSAGASGAAGGGNTMQITIMVNGKIEGMTPENQSQIVAAVVSQVNKTNFQQKISNGFIRTPNR